MTWSDSDQAFKDGKGKFWAIRQQRPPDNRWYIVEYELKDAEMNITSTDFGYFATGEEAMEAAERAAKRSVNEN